MFLSTEDLAIGRNMKTISSLLQTVVVSYVILLLACSTSTAIAPINMTKDGVAIKGYDPVAYFTMARPVQGQQELQYQWQGARWLFATREHLELFRENPKKFAPQYGGY